MFLEISQNSQENFSTRVSFLSKKRLWHRCFPVKFAEFLRTPFSQNTSGRLFLKNEGFLNYHLIKVSELLAFVLFSFFILSNIIVKTFFKNNSAMLYLIALRAKLKEKNKLKL